MDKRTNLVFTVDSLTVYRYSDHPDYLDGLEPVECDLSKYNSFIFEGVYHFTTYGYLAIIVIEKFTHDFPYFVSFSDLVKYSNFMAVMSKLENTFLKNLLHNKDNVKTYFDDIKKDDNTEYEYVNHPEHYNTYGKEVIDMMRGIWGDENTALWCKMTAFKYRMRMGTKPDNPVEQDLAKEKWYLDKANELVKSGTE